jgi:hypothetical protein
VRKENENAKLVRSLAYRREDKGWKLVILLEVFANGISEFTFIGTRESINNLMVFNESESWHSRDLIFLRNFRSLININLNTKS